MDEPASPAARAPGPRRSAGSTGVAVAAPSSVSDILYLIAAQHGDILSAATRQRLGQANICFIRGDLRTALSSVDAVLDELDRSQPAYGDVVAFRLFLGSMVEPDPGRWRAGGGHAGSGAPRVVALCVESNGHWNAGSLFDGLWLNQSAVQHCADVAAIWRVYADVLLAKKLADIHVPHQASRLIRETQDRTDSFGLHAFGAVPEALRSVLRLQSGQFDEALSAAATAVRIGEQRVSAVGVQLALSVSAMAHLGLGEQDAASACLESFHAQPAHYAMPDSVARTAFAEVALVAAGQGPVAAAAEIRARWAQLGTDSACFIEDPTRPAWLVAVARRAGDTALAERSLRAIERLAANNRGVSLLEAVAGHARTAYAGGPAGLPSVLDCEAAPPRARARGRPARLPALSRREDEIARLVGRGLTNQQVATQLGLSPHTVNFHLRGIFRKLSISSRVTLGRIIAQHDQPPGSFPDGPPPPRP